MYTLETPLGNLQYQPVNMLNIDLAVARWKMTNQPPKVPKIRQAWSGTETGKLITMSFQLYGKHSNYITREQKADLRAQIEEKLPLVDNPHDEQYLKDKADYANQIYIVHWENVITHGVLAGEENEKVLSMLFASDILREKNTPDEIKNTDAYKKTTYKHLIYDAIVKASCVTADMVHNCLLALDRYYNGEPFLEVLERRSKKTDDDIKTDAFRHTVHDLFIRYELLPYAESLPIDDRCMLAARLIVRANVEAWVNEDARQEAQTSTTMKNLIKKGAK